MSNKFRAYQVSRANNPTEIWYEYKTKKAANKLRDAYNGPMSFGQMEKGLFAVVVITDPADSIWDANGRRKVNK